MKHEKNYFMFNPKEHKPRELTEEEKEKMLKLFRNPSHQKEARQIVKLWLMDNYMIEFDIFDYINTFSYSDSQKQQIFNMYLFIREYTAEICNNKKPDGMNELEELLFSIFEKGAQDFYNSLESRPTKKRKLTEEEQAEIKDYMDSTGGNEDGKKE